MSRKMVYDPQDTIAAIASAPGSAARGVVRVAGPAALRYVASLWRPTNDALLENASLESLVRPTMLSGAIELGPPLGLAPCRLYCWPNERSYARQPTVEIHTIGSPPLLEGILRAICRAGARPAGPGEFTLRAFLAGRLDLTQAEAVLGVIDAADRRELDVALGQLAGGLAVPLTDLRNSLLDLLAHLEAGLDFVEEDIEFITAAELQTQLSGAAAQIAAIEQRATTRTVTRDAIRATLVGSPNVGKSSLFNALVARATSIVSPTPGATRDYVAAALELHGATIELIDTAGATGPAENLEHPRQGVVETAAQRATAEQREQAQVEVLCLDATRSLNDWERATLAASPRATIRLTVLTKIDGPRQLENIGGAIETSSANRLGLDLLRTRLREAALAGRTAEEGNCLVAATSARCRESLRGATAALIRANALAEGRRAEELIAVEVRLALDEIGQVTGAVYTEDVLDRVFSRFCIGK
ncbi:MAG TPA: GTPase [Pirellulales bacterium]|jgi:tRNA modification GTPase